MYCVFDSFVSSILNYGCEIWGYTKSKELERIHLKFCKQLLGVKTSTCNMAAVYGELGRYPLFVNRYTRIIKYCQFGAKQLYQKMSSLKHCIMTWLVD